MERTPGFTLLEIIIAVAILLLIAAATMFFFGDIRNYEALSRDTTSVISNLERARSLTLAGQDASQYGVHFDNETVFLFRGTSYAASGEIQATQLHSSITFDDINIANSSSTVVFDRLKGSTVNSGTITLRHTGTDATTTVIINNTGIIERTSD